MCTEEQKLVPREAKILTTRTDTSPSTVQEPTRTAKVDYIVTDAYNAKTLLAVRSCRSSSLGGDLRESQLKPGLREGGRAILLDGVNLQVENKSSQRKKTEAPPTHVREKCK